MNRTHIIALAAVLLVAASIGIGYAVTYTGVTETTSELGYEKYSVSLTNAQGGVVSEPIAFDGPTCTTETVDTLKTITVTGTTATATGYQIKVECPSTQTLNVRAKLVMEDQRSWAIIDRISFTVTSGDTNTYTWQPTGSSWNDASISLGNMSPSNTYDLTITVVYKSIVFTDIISTETDDFLDLTGMKVILAGSVHDPIVAAA